MLELPRKRELLFFFIDRYNQYNSVLCCVMLCSAVLCCVVLCCVVVKQTVAVVVAV